MAKQIASTGAKRSKTRVRRPGVHAKNRHSNSKKGKHYVKAYAGQGR